MEEFIDALEKSIADSNWYSSLFVALTLPDICGRIEYPNKSSSKRYAEWFDKYLGSMYTKPVGDMVHTFLSGNDCYALRCALLHEGLEEIGEQRAQEVLECFYFTEPPGFGTVHRNQRGNVLQLQVDEFVKELISGIRQWLVDIEGDEEKQDKLAKLMKVHRGVSF